MQTQVESLAAITRLQEAAINGDVSCLNELLRTYPRILDMQRCCLAQSPLHLALELGHSHFAKMILDAKPMLAEDQFDQAKRSPLHISSEKGQLDMVKLLVSMSPSMCFARDHEGRNPVHVAAMKGHNDVVNAFILTKPQAVRERTIHEGETVLHLSLKCGQLETFKLLLRSVGDNLLNSKDNNGNTVLHLAVADKQYEIVKLLILDNKKGMKKDAINKGGKTAMDICLGSTMDYKNDEMWKILKFKNALTAKDVLSDKPGGWMDTQRNALMVVASLIATMAFQFGVNPPGGVWQDDKDGHHAGWSVLADSSPDKYKHLFSVNTVGLVSSFSVILLLISGFPSHRVTMVILMFFMWIAVSTVTYSYIESASYLASVDLMCTREGTCFHDSGLFQGFTYTLCIYFGIFGGFLIYHIVRYYSKIKEEGHNAFDRCDMLLTNCYKVDNPLRQSV